jgi:hypothetical protein
MAGARLSSSSRILPQRLARAEKRAQRNRHARRLGPLPHQLNDVREDEALAIAPVPVLVKSIAPPCPLIRAFMLISFARWKLRLCLGDLGRGCACTRSAKAAFSKSPLASCFAIVLSFRCLI